MHPTYAQYDQYAYGADPYKRHGYGGQRMDDMDGGVYAGASHALIDPGVTGGSYPMKQQNNFYNAAQPGSNQIDSGSYNQQNQNQAGYERKRDLKFSDKDYQGSGMEGGYS